MSLKERLEQVSRHCPPLSPHPEPAILCPWDLEKNPPRLRGDKCHVTSWDMGIPPQLQRLNEFSRL